VNRVRDTGIDLVIDVGEEAQPLGLPLTEHVEPVGNERRILDLDTDLLDGRHQKVAVVVTSQHTGKQPDHRRTADRCTQVVPRTIARDTHVEIAAKRRVPQMHRRQAALFAGRDLRQQIRCLSRIAHIPSRRRYRSASPSRRRA